MPRFVRFHEIGGPEVLRVEDHGASAPAPGHVRIRVSAIGVNRADAMFRSGLHLLRPNFPSGLGYEAAGVVESIGEGVEGLALGDVVSAIPQMEPNRYNTYAELASIPAAFLVKHPAVLTMPEAAALWSSYLTAYGALIEVARLSRGEFLVITAGSSTVGLASIQIANMLGATPIVTSRGRQKSQALLEAGAADVIVTEEDDVTSRILSITGGKGVRVIFDAVGGAGVTALADAMSQDGMLLEYAQLSGQATPFPLFAAIVKRLTMVGYRIDNLDAGRVERGKRFIVDGVERGKLRPLIARTFRLDDIVQAHRFLESNEQVGKIVLTP
jgi:NADPH:quinone reductase-like Zn-dependent oxidoreductase